MRKLCLYIGLFLVAFAAHAQTYDFRNYSVEDGLAQSQVMCVFQDSKGYMWFGTGGGGASMFDGKTFKNFTPENGAISNTIYSITEDKQQNMYFATYDGLQIKSTFKNIRIDTSKGLPANTAYKVFIDKSEKIWVGTEQGVCTLDKTFKPVKLKGDKLLEASSVFTIYQDNAGNYWFGTLQNGACCYSPANNTYTWYNTKNGLGDNFIRSFNEDGKGNIYIGTVSGLCTVDGKKEIKKIELPGLLMNFMAITSIVKDKNNTFWLSTNNGVLKYSGHGETYQRFSSENGMVSDLILSSYIDSENNLWFTTNGFGVSKLSSEAIVNYTKKDGLPGDYINSIYQTKDGKVWVAERYGGLLCINGKERKKYNLNKLDYSRVINCMAEDKDARLWIGTYAGLSTLYKEKITNFWTEEGDYQTIFSIYHSSKGIHYLGTGKGLVIFGENGEKEPVEVVNKLKGEHDLAIYNITEDNAHNLWLATASYGAIRYDGKSAKIFNDKDKFTSKTVYNVSKDKNGNLWFGTEEGIFYYDFKKFVNIGEKVGLISNLAYFLVFDNQNRLWIGTNKGIDALQVDEFVSGKKINLKHYGKDEGLVGLECNMNAAIKDNQGTLWFGNVKGVTTFNPRFEKTNDQEPSC